jgi:signal peptidase
MLVPGGVHEAGIVSAENDAPGPQVIAHGTRETTTTYSVVNGGLVPTVSYIEAEVSDLQVTPWEVSVPPRERVDATVTVHAPDEIDYYQYRLVEYRYLAVLPTSVIRSLYTLHPWAPIFVIDLLLVGVVLLGSTLILDDRASGLLMGSVRRVLSRLR